MDEQTEEAPKKGKDAQVTNIARAEQLSVQTINSTYVWNVEQNNANNLQSLDIVMSNSSGIILYSQLEVWYRKEGKGEDVIFNMMLANHFRL